MACSSSKPPRPSQGISVGFTLLELLAALAIVAILAALIMPALHRAKVQSKTREARLEIARLVSALQDYESTYGRFPVSFDASRIAEGLHEDVTYGGVLVETGTWVAGPGYLTNNSEVMAPLLDLQYYGDGAPTINRGHVRNPQRIKFLEATFGGGTNTPPGVGVDGQYRDPWGSPYVVTLDLNHDGRSWDAMYREPAVSADPMDSKRGLFGLNQATDSQSEPVFEAPSRVMVWSAGPDRHLSTLLKANQGVNKDNILSWKQ